MVVMYLIMGRECGTRNMTTTTFIIRIHHMEHQSWQGQVAHVQSGQVLAFRSGLEMLRIMDAATANQRETEDELDDEKIQDK